VDIETTKIVAVVGVVEMKAVVAVDIEAAKIVAVVGVVETKVAAAAAGIETAETVAVASVVEPRAVAGDSIASAKTVDVAGFREPKAAVAAVAVAGIETTKTHVVAGFLLKILRPHANTGIGAGGSGDTGPEQSTLDCVTQRAVARVSGELGFVAACGAEIPQVSGNNVPQADMSSDFDMKRLESDPGHRGTV
jgi:hypothetical protein